VEYVFNLIAMQGDSVGGCPELIIINCAVIYELKHNI
jgi:hypothetical protein